MPTQNPRINLTLRPALAATIRRLSELQGQSMSRTIVQLLEVAEPALQRTAAAIEAVYKLEGEAKTSMLATVLRQLRDVDELALAMTGQPGLFDQMENQAIEAVAKQHGVPPPVKTRRRGKRARPK